MNTIPLSRIVSFLLICSLQTTVFTQRLAAQYAEDQGLSLKAVETVNVVMGTGLRGDANLYQKVTLELRKVGLAIADDKSDIILNLSFQQRPGTVDRDNHFRMDVEQEVIVDRTGDKLQLVTWYYEYTWQVPNASWDTKPLTEIVQEGVDRFLSDYLTANGR